MRTCCQRGQRVSSIKILHSCYRTGDPPAHPRNEHSSRYQSHPQSGILCSPTPHPTPTLHLQLGYTKLTLWCNAIWCNASIRKSPLAPSAARDEGGRNCSLPLSSFPHPRHMPEREPDSSACGFHREKGFSLCLLPPAAIVRSKSQILPVGDKECKRHPSRSPKSLRYLCLPLSLAGQAVF